MASDDLETAQRWRGPAGLWDRFALWLGLDRSPPVDLLEADPVRHFKEWDRYNPDRYWG